jgi:hypothetical protein
MSGVTENGIALSVAEILLRAPERMPSTGQKVVTAASVLPFVPLHEISRDRDRDSPLATAAAIPWYERAIGIGRTAGPTDRNHQYFLADRSWCRRARVADGLSGVRRSDVHKNNGNDDGKQCPTSPSVAT